MRERYPGSIRQSVKALKNICIAAALTHKSESMRAGYFVEPEKVIRRLQVGMHPHWFQWDNLKRDIRSDRFGAKGP